jgi:nitrate reductase gamma subunit
MSLLQIAIYFAVVLFAVTVSAKVIRIARMPVHLRWDLYPIPHEGLRGKYGGSYYEEVNWWTKPRRFSLISDVKEVAREIIFIQSLFRHNRSLWFFSFPFHIGMYCIIGLGALLTLGAVWGVSGGAAGATSTGTDRIANYVIVILGSMGWILGIFGAAGLFFSRLINPQLRTASLRGDYFNLLILLALFIAGLISHFAVDRSYSILQGFIGHLVRFQPADMLPASVKAELWLAVIVILYLPFTHMTHFIGKFFTYHRVRWEDHPNIRGGKIEKAVTRALGNRLTWEASHIKPGATWADATAEDTSHDAQ